MKYVYDRKTGKVVEKPEPEPDNLLPFDERSRVVLDAYDEYRRLVTETFR